MQPGFHEMPMDFSGRDEGTFQVSTQPWEFFNEIAKIVEFVTTKIHQPIVFYSCFSAGILEIKKSMVGLDLWGQNHEGTLHLQYIQYIST